MLVLRNDWQAVLPKLTELGNGLALVAALDAMLGTSGNAHLMQLAPLLGINLNAQGHVQQQVHAAAFLLPVNDLWLACVQWVHACDSRLNL